MPRGDNPEALARSAGFIKGLASTLVPGIQAGRKRRAAESLYQRKAEAKRFEKEAGRKAAATKYKAYTDLMRDISGKKTGSGQELMEMGMAMGLDESDMAQIDPTKDYQLNWGTAWLNQLGRSKTAGLTDVGKMRRHLTPKAAAAWDPRRHAGQHTKISDDWARSYADILPGEPLGSVPPEKLRVYERMRVGMYRGLQLGLAPQDAFGQAAGGTYVQPQSWMGIQTAPGVAQPGAPFSAQPLHGGPATPAAPARQPAPAATTAPSGATGGHPGAAKRRREIKQREAAAAETTIGEALNFTEELSRRE